LSFPEKAVEKSPLLNSNAKYIDNVPFPKQFAAQVAISANKKLIAIAYGISRNGDGFTYFGLYSLADGQRLATLAADAYKCGILHGALFNDEIQCQMAPITGSIEFSRDSRSFFGSSKHLRQWNVSAMSH
jgi:hypothetical protein